MSLNIQKLENARKLEGGIVQARCPACAEGGHDRAGEHLRVYPDGKFGCCVYPKDREHRKRIFALAGSRERQDIRVKVAGPRVAEVIQGGVLGRLGRVFQTPAKPQRLGRLGRFRQTLYIYNWILNFSHTYRYIDPSQASQLRGLRLREVELDR